MIDVILMRHADKQRQADSGNNSHLSPEGIRQARNAGEMIQKMSDMTGRAPVILSSNTNRTIETAEQAFGHAPDYIDSRLNAFEHGFDRTKIRQETFATLGSVSRFGAMGHTPHGEPLGLLGYYLNASLHDHAEALEDNDLLVMVTHAHNIAMFKNTYLRNPISHKSRVSRRGRNLMKVTRLLHDARHIAPASILPMQYDTETLSLAASPHAELLTPIAATPMPSDPLELVPRSYIETPQLETA